MLVGVSRVHRTVSVRTSGSVPAPAGRCRLVAPAYGLERSRGRGPRLVWRLCPCPGTDAHGLLRECLGLRATPPGGDHRRPTRTYSRRGVGCGLADLLLRYERRDDLV